MMNFSLKFYKVNNVLKNSVICSVKDFNLVKIPICSISSGRETFDNIIQKIPIDESFGDLSKSVFEKLNIQDFLFTRIGQAFFESFHETTSLPWWATITCMAIYMKIVTIPSLINQTRITYFDKKELLDNYTKKQVVLSHEEANRHFSFYPILQGTIFAIASPALLRMCNRIPELQTGGISWISDLTLIDNTYILPTVAAGFFWLTMRVNAKRIKSHYENYYTIPTLLSFGFLIGLPSAVSLYWCANNAFTLFILLLIKKMGLMTRVFIEIPSKQSSKLSYDNATEAVDEIKQK